MALTYVDIEQQKNTRIWIFFTIVLLFYFIIAIILANLTKVFFVTQSEMAGVTHPFLTGKQVLYVILFAFIAAVFHSVYSICNAMSFIKQNLKTQDIDLSDTYHKRFNNIVDGINHLGLQGL